jgi:Na+/proline symporter
MSMRNDEPEEDIVTESLHAAWYVAISIVVFIDLLLVVCLLSVPPNSVEIRHALYSALILSASVPLSLLLSIYWERRRGR